MSSVLSDLSRLDYLIEHPLTWIVIAFQLWMLIHAIREREWVWAVLIFFLFAFAAVWYYFYVYRASPSSTRGFELPGAQSRKRIKELQAQIHHLDKPHHHSQLGDVYLQQGRLDLAEASYRAALARDGQDLDTRAHLGQCLLRQKKPADARPWLEGVVAENPKHDYGYSLMAYAETLTALGDTDRALATWQQVTANHSYPRAKVQLAELYNTMNQPQLARTELEDVLADDPHTPAFQRKRDRVWLRRARRLRRNSEIEQLKAPSGLRTNHVTRAKTTAR